MPEYLSPGIYVEEYDSSPRSIEGVGTSTAGFIGLAEKGTTVGVPALVTNLPDYVRQFGGFLSEYTHGGYRYLPYAVENFFANGGTRAYVMRVAPVDAKKASGGQGVLRFTAANEGAWGNRINIAFTATNAKKVQLLEATDEKSYRAKSAGGLKVGDIVEFDGEYNKVAAVFENVITFENAFTKDPVDATLVPQKFVFSSELEVSIRSDGETEVYAGVNLNELSTDHIARRLSASEIVTTEAEVSKEILPPIQVLFGEGEVKGTVTFSGGFDGTIESVDPGVFLGNDDGPGKRSGIEAFKENNLVSILSVPGITFPEVIVSLVNHCETEKNRFAIIDVPLELTKTGDIAKYREIIDSSYAAIYHPWLQVYDRASQKSIFVPPGGSVAGVFSRTDIQRGVHKAPANEPILATGLSSNYSAKEQDVLNPIGVNLIRQLPGQGIRVWGARTASSDSNFKYVNVRRLFIYVEESIRNSTNWVVFEPNTPDLWSRVRLTITSFLEGLFRSGMLAGEGSAQAYFVDLGPTTMSRDDIMNGRLICNIGIAPVRPAEFVIFRITQFTAEAEAAAE